jgi:hypothetical protein
MPFSWHTDCIDGEVNQVTTPWFGETLFGPPMRRPHGTTTVVAFPTHAFAEM